MYTRALKKERQGKEEQEMKSKSRLIDVERKKLRRSTRGSSFGRRDEEGGGGGRGRRRRRTSMDTDRISRINGPRRSMEETRRRVGQV